MTAKSLAVVLGVLAVLFYLSIPPSPEYGGLSAADWAESLKKPSPSDRAKAMPALAAIVRDAESDLNPVQRLRLAATRWAGGSTASTPAAEGLCAGLADPSPEVRGQAVAAIASLGELAGPVVAPKIASADERSLWGIKAVAKRAPQALLPEDVARLDARLGGSVPRDEYAAVFPERVPASASDPRRDAPQPSTALKDMSPGQREDALRDETFDQRDAREHFEKQPDVALQKNTHR